MATILPKTLALKFDRAKKDFMASISRQVDNLFGDLLDDLQVQLEVDPQYLTNHASSPLPKKQAFSQPSKVVPTKLQKLDKTSPAIENQTADDVITTKLSETHQANGDNGYSFYIKGKTAYDLSKQIERIECMPELDSSNLIIDKDFPKMRVNGHKRPKEYRCKFEGCKKIFRHSASLNIHMRIHTGNKPYRQVVPLSFLLMIIYF